MLAPTHATFGLVFAIVTGTVLGLTLSPSVAAFACLGALLPDVDTTTSTVSRLAFPLARVLERRFGHRTATHSLLGLAVVLVPVVPLGLLNRQWPVAFALGYLSHLLIDSANKAGVPLFYPSPIRAVLPKNEAFRVAVGSRGELGVLVALAVALAVLLPLHQMGFTRALHALTRTTAGAIRDYRGWQGRSEVWVEVDGIFPLSARRVQAHYRILGLADPATLVVLDPPTGRIYTVGAGKEANLYPYRIRAHQGRAITVRRRTVGLTEQLLRDLLREVPPEGETYFQGSVKTADAPVVPPDPESYEVLKAGGHELELRFARPRDLEAPPLATLFVRSGQVLVQTVIPDGSAPPAPGPPAPPPEFDDVTELFIPHLTDPARELLVREGERVHQGQLLARLTYRDPELERRRRDAEERLAEKQAAYTLQEGKVRMARALVSSQLAAAGVVPREGANLAQAAAKVAHGRRELARATEEARRLTEIYAPLDGQLLTIRVHVIHGSDSTAVLRLLYRRAAAGRGGPRGGRARDVGLTEDLGRGPIGLDTAIFVYYIEEHPRYLALVEPVFEGIDCGRWLAVTSGVTLLETVVIPYRIGDETLADRHEGFLTLSRGLTLVELDRALLRAAARLRATAGVRTPDALQLGAALDARCTAYLTNDRALPCLRGLPVLRLRDYA